MSSNDSTNNNSTNNNSTNNNSTNNNSTNNNSTNNNDSSTDNYNKMRADNFRQNGIYYGYPSCCIEEFIMNNVYEKGCSLISAAYGGFVPCQKHTQMILNKKINIRDLIGKRSSQYEFPIDTDDEENAEGDEEYYSE